MVTTIPAKIDTLQIIRSLYNDKSLTIFRRVVDGVELEKLDEGMTRKQFYSRLSNLKKSHLITREKVKIKKGHGQYELTSLGLVVHRALQLIDKGTSLGWALNAYDAAIHQQKDVSVEDKRRVLDSLVADHEIRSLVGKNHHPTLDEVISKYYQNQQRQQQRQQQEQEQQ